MHSHVINIFAYEMQFVCKYTLESPTKNGVCNGPLIYMQAHRNLEILVYTGMYDISYTQFAEVIILT